MTYDDNQTRERIQKLMHKEGITQNEFAKRIGRQQSNVSHILTGIRGIPRSFYKEIIDAFPGLNRDWLMFGEGNMFDTIYEPKHEHPKDTRPRLPESMSEGHLEEYYGNGKKRVLCQEKPIVTQFSDYDFSLIMKNNRMSPKYEIGDELFFKKATFPEWGNDFLLDTDDGPKFKRIYEGVDKNGDECVRCVSYNREEFPDFTIKTNLIHEYYRCVGVLRIL